MMQNIRLLIFSIFLMAVFLSVFPASALDFSVSGDLSYLTDDTNARWNAEISGENAVWVERFGYGQAVYLYSLKDREKTLLTFSMDSDYMPAISGETVFWSERSDYKKPYNIVLYNLTGRDYRYLDPYPANQGSPDANEDYAVWLDGRYRGFANIFLKNLKTGEVFLFRESGTNDKKSPQISGEFVYWVEKGVLYKKPVSGGSVEKIAEGLSDGFSVSGTRAVWEQMSGGHYAVMMYDENNGIISEISVGDYDIRHPDISGNIVVGEDYSGRDSDIFLYDAATGTYAMVYSGYGDQINPKISGSSIIWTDRAGGLFNTVLFEISTDAKPDAYFEAFKSDSKDGLSPLVIHFTGSSAITPGTRTSYVWDFGDGGLSSEGSPVHTYTNPGKYSVSLTVSNDFGTDVFTRNDYITVGELPSADFTYEGIKGVSPYTTRFHDISTGDIDNRTWDFGDGTGSVLKNPFHIFRYPGLYTVSLTVRNKYGDVTETKEDLIDVGGVPKAAFVYSYDEDSTDVRPVVRFTDISSADPDSWLWYFGDGTFSTEQNPVHTFEKAGIYDVSLKVSNSYAEDIKTERNIVLAKLSDKPLQEIIIVPGEAGLMPGDTMQFVAAGKDTAGQAALINPEWSVLNTTVAGMSLSGVLTAKTIGSTEVVCEYMNLTAHSYITVGEERYARSSSLPVLVMPASSEGLSEDTKSLLRIFYRDSE